MPPRRRNGAMELGVILLIMELMKFGINRIPPVTLATIIGQTLLFVGVIQVPWDKADVCISTYNILKKKDWRRLVLSSIEHGDDMHLYYNMASFLIKGRSLEKRYGSKNFGLLLATLTLLTSVMYIVLGKVFAELAMDESYLHSCAIGFSGVIFALKVVTTYEQPEGAAVVGGIRMPGKYAAWAELMLIHFLVPNASFIGHLAGILAGLIYLKTYFGTYLDGIFLFITGEPMIHGGDGNRYYNSDRNSSSNQDYYEQQYYSPPNLRHAFRQPNGFSRPNGYGWNINRHFYDSYGGYR